MCSRLMLIRTIALTAWIGLGARSLRADDLILIPNSTVQATGGQIRGKITSETPTTVRIEADSGGPRDVPIDQIAEIAYSGQPASLPLAETREQAGALDEALDLYAKSASEAAGNPLIAQQAQFGRVRVLAKLAESDPARLDEAITALDQFTTANPNSRFLGPALERLTRLSLSKKEPDRAARPSPGSSRFPGPPTARRCSRPASRPRRGRTPRPSPPSTPSSPAPERLVSEQRGPADPRRDSGLRRQVSRGRDRRPRGDRRRRPEAAELQAHAHNTLGDCLRAAGRPKDALYAYLHTDILYDEDSEQHARALAEIAQLWRELRRDDRADEVIGRLRQLYPKSPYAKDASP